MVSQLSACLAPLGLHCALLPTSGPATVGGLEPMHMLSGPWAPPAEMPAPHKSSGVEMSAGAACFTSATGTI